MAPGTKRKRAPKARPVQAPRGRAQAAPVDRRRRLTWLALAIAVVAIGVGAVVLRHSPGRGSAASGRGLPATPDYHSLLVSTSNPQVILLGAHDGLYRSGDGGRSWGPEALGGQDAMNLARPSGGSLWTAGHDVLAKSADEGRTWVNVSPPGLPSLDVHGFAVDPRSPRTLYAAIAGAGLYRSTNGGSSFSLVSKRVGGGVMALAIKPDGTILAGDMQQGLLRSRDDGKTWRRILSAQLMGLAINPRDPKRILATGPEIGLSTDGGATWRQTLKLGEGAGPVAWSPSNPELAYVVGFDRTFYRSRDGGLTWQPVR